MTRSSSARVSPRSGHLNSVQKAGWVSELVDKAAHRLPEQAPLRAFVHHNTLHAFEHLPFEEAVVVASKVLGTEPFQQEHEFRLHIKTGRIQGEDLDAVVAESTNEETRVLFPGGPTNFDFRRRRLGHLFSVPNAQALRFLLDETDAKLRFHPDVSAQRRTEILGFAKKSGGGGAVGRAPETTILSELWNNLTRVTLRPVDTTPPKVRTRDALLRTTAIDSDELVHPLLIRLSAAFLDQGVAYWPMPGRELGFLGGVRRLYELRGPPPDRAFRGLAQTLRTQESECWSAETTIVWALEELNIPNDRWEACIEATLLSLRGWAGMMRQLELRPDRAPVKAPPTSLVEFLAVQLLLETVAARNILGDHFGASANFAVLENAPDFDTREDASDGIALEQVYEAFVFAQQSSVDITALAKRRNAKLWIQAVTSFNEIERRTLLHFAYERRHRIEVLDGLTAHCQMKSIRLPKPQFQSVFCIDDREESLRRHLEECFPAAITFGYAGFYGVAMDYQGMDDVRSRPLCPVSIRPKHFIREEIVRGSEELAYRARRHRHAVATRFLSVGSTTLIRGGLLSLVFGTLAMIPLVFRSLFPRAMLTLLRTWNGVVGPRPKTRLNVEYVESKADQGETGRQGYSIEEMTQIVADALQTMGLVDEFCPIVLMVGHGSSSLNNPHEAAHDCGATGGGHGGSNARAFAIMANHPAVRENLQKRGINLPSESWFVGAFHNTCDDAMTFYDEDLVPDRVRQSFESVKSAMRKACMLDAHERCRRFETAPTELSLNRAMAYVETHANDLGEPRPEYGHATNAVCIVGRRHRTRGLFLDRRAFLVSYDPESDPTGACLTSLLLSVGPVGAGINLEYYFSFVDPSGYGSGTKLPHNITGLIGVMDGHSTDLRTGLPWQMVEIHEPVRLLLIVEVQQELLEAALASEPALAQLVQKGWIQLVTWDPDSEKMAVYEHGEFRRYRPESSSIPVIQRSTDYYRGKRQHLPPAHIQAALGGIER